jgi:RNA polymerase sigma-70 factor, ECF subfamily
MESKGSESTDALDERRHARLRQLIADHFPAVWKYLRRVGIPAHLAEDASQEVFLVAARRVDDIKGEHAAERSFLLGTAYRVGRELLRKAHRESPEEDVDAGPGSERNPEEQLDEKQACEVVYRVLAELEEDVRPIFVLYEMDGLTMIEISKLLGLPIGTVGSRLRRAREDFKARFERHRKRLGGMR